MRQKAVKKTIFLSVWSCPRLKIAQSSLDVIAAGQVFGELYTLYLLMQGIHEAFDTVTEGTSGIDFNITFLFYLFHTHI